VQTTAIMPARSPVLMFSPLSADNHRTCGARMHWLPPDTSAEAWRCLYSAASARLLLRFSFILRRPTTIAFKTAGLTPLVMSARTSAR
jgi:hypothetical protein